MNTKITAGLIIFLAGAALVIWGVIELVSNLLGVSLLLGGAAAIAVSVYVFNYKPKLKLPGQ